MKSRINILFFLLALSGVTLPYEISIAQSLNLGFPIIYPLVRPRLSSTFGPRKHPILKAHRHHGGVDLAAPEKSHVRAVTSGVVVFAGTYGGYGKLVTVQHAGDKYSLYGHLSEFLVNVGDRVQPGQLLGRVGHTGAATGPHLHFEWRESGKSIDPLKIFPSLAAEAQG